MSGNPALGQFLMAQDVSQAAVISAYCIASLSDHDTDMIRKIIESNWDDEEQMVANLLQFPTIIPEDIRIDSIVRGLKDVEMPYYVLSAAVGMQSLKLNDKDIIICCKLLRNAVFNQQGVVSTRAFITLLPYLIFPEDTDFFLQILKSKKSPLHECALSWLVLKFKDKKEMFDTFEAGGISKDLISEGGKKIDKHFESLAHGKCSPVSVEVFDFIPNLNDFEAMLDKEDTLAEIFDDLDSDKDCRISSNEVQAFLEDIGQDVTMETLVQEMKGIGVDDDGKIDKDAFIEMMFPKFKC